MPVDNNNDKKETNPWVSKANTSLPMNGNQHHHIRGIVDIVHHRTIDIRVVQDGSPSISLHDEPVSKLGLYMNECRKSCFDTVKKTEPRWSRHILGQSRVWGLNRYPKLFKLEDCELISWRRIVLEFHKLFLKFFWNLGYITPNVIPDQGTVNSLSINTRDVPHKLALGGG